MMQDANPSTFTIRANGTWTIYGHTGTVGPAEEEVSGPRCDLTNCRLQE